MTLATLPTEIYQIILSSIPPAYDDSSVRVLLAFTLANRQLLAAAHTSSLWKPHYFKRYLHTVEKREEERRTRLNGDWRRIYAERRSLDKQALKLVDEIREFVEGERHEKARILLNQYGFDIWDALKLESEIPIPSCFRSPESLALASPSSLKVEPADDALSRRFWARSVMGMLARVEAVDVWVQLFSAEAKLVSFEDALGSLSSGFNVSLQEVRHFNYSVLL